MSAASRFLGEADAVAQPRAAIARRIWRWGARGADVEDGSKPGCAGATAQVACRRVRRLLVPAIAVLLGVAASPAAADRGPAGGARFSLGVAAGDVRSTSAILWGRADRSTVVTLTVARDRSLRQARRRFSVWALRSNDFTVQRRVRGLRPGTRYFFRWHSAGGRSDLGMFRTAPSRRANVAIKFAWAGDYDAQPAPGERHPYWNRFQIFRHMRAERNHFNIGLGDTIYSDTEVPGVTNRDAVTVRQKWGKYRMNLRQRRLARLRSAAGFYSVWDDHEFYNNFSRPQNRFTTTVDGTQRGVRISGELLYDRGVRAFRDYSPVRYTTREGLYRRVRWGRNLELFLLDVRSFRSAPASAGGTCNNPDSGDDDLAPTLPQTRRDIFAVLEPSLAEPVRPACLASINDPDRTYLGRRQFRALTRAVRRSNARFKVIVSAQPIKRFYVDVYDRWEGYEAERARLLRALQNTKNILFVSADLHATLVYNARFTTFPEEGGLEDSGIADVTVAPVATASIENEFDPVVGEGVTQTFDDVFLEPPPPVGMGALCSVPDAFAYASVRVSPSRLTITPKDRGGRLLRDEAGQPCGPFHFSYQS